MSLEVVEELSTSGTNPLSTGIVLLSIGTELLSSGIELLSIGIEILSTATGGVEILILRGAVLLSRTTFYAETRPRSAKIEVVKKRVRMTTRNKSEIYS